MRKGDVDARHADRLLDCVPGMTTKTDMSDMPNIARLRIEIDEVTPAVIRRVEVPVTIRLDDLHFVLQIAIGWQNCHPFEFRAGNDSSAKIWGLLDRDNPNRRPCRRKRRRSPTCWRRRLSPTTTSSGTIGGTQSPWRRSSVTPDGIYPRLISAEGRCPPADIASGL
jgi:hypothetical protein